MRSGISARYEDGGYAVMNEQICTCAVLCTILKLGWAQLRKWPCSHKICALLNRRRRFFSTQFSCWHICFYIWYCCVKSLCDTLSSLSSHTALPKHYLIIIPHINTTFVKELVLLSFNKRKANMKYVLIHTWIYMYQKAIWYNKSMSSFTEYFGLNFVCTCTHTYCYRVDQC